MDFLDFRGPGFFSLWQPLAAFGSLWRPLAAVGSLWRPLATFSSPLKEVYGALEAWTLDAWSLGGTEAWSLVALAEAGGLEARGFEAGQVFRHARRSERSADGGSGVPLHLNCNRTGRRRVNWEHSGPVRCELADPRSFCT